MGPEWEVRLQPPTSTVKPQASSRSEPIYSAAANISSHQQQALPTMFPEVTTPEQQATTGINWKNNTALYQHQYHGPNLIPIVEQVHKLQSISLSQFPQTTQPMNGYSSPLMMYPNQPTYSFPIEVSASATFPQYYEGIRPLVPNTAANTQPVGRQRSTKGLIPIWLEVAQTNLEIRTARTFSGNTQLPPFNQGSLQEDIKSQEILQLQHERIVDIIQTQRMKKRT